MKSLLLITWILALSWAASAHKPQGTTSSEPGRRNQIVTAAQVNGVYRFYKSEFSVLALGHNKLKVQFDGVYTTLAKSVNVGYAIGEAMIEGNVATFVPPDTQGCKMTMTFLPGKLVVKQEGSDVDCGFGHNVNATGTYRKIRSGKPKFQPPP